MDVITRLPKLLGWAIFGLVGIQIVGWVCGALGKTAIGRAELHDRAYFFEGWAIFFGVADRCVLLAPEFFDLRRTRDALSSGHQN